jgi:DNA polymerase V
VTSLPGLIEAVTEFATRAAIKLQRQKSLVNQVLVFAHTSPFKPVARIPRNCVVPLPAPTGDTKHIWAQLSPKYGECSSQVIS